MQRTQVINELKQIIKSDRYGWANDAFDRAVDAALIALSNDMPSRKQGELTLSTTQSFYDLPSDFAVYLSTSWGKPAKQTWDDLYPGRLPCFFSSKTASGYSIVFTVPPSQKHLSAYGSQFLFVYGIKHQLTDSTDTLGDQLKPLLILRSLIELIKELIARDVTEPVQLNKGFSNVPSNSTPSAVLNVLLHDYRSQL